MLDVTPIPAFSDNYIWCLNDPADKAAVVVDPGDGRAVLEALAARGLELAGIMITHHHFDHTGGIDTLLAESDVPVYGPHNPTIQQVSQRFGQGDAVTILGVEFSVLEVPGHTLDHIAFYSAGEQSQGRQPILFCGDTLFAGGCGRLFEGDAPMMHASLAQLAALPATTRVYCAHEYTLANLAFAVAVEPANEELLRRIERDSQSREQALPTVPSSLELELATNPFLRCGDAAVAAQMQQRDGINGDDPVAVFAAVRAWKDNF
ncbi:MAG: hydroxyacylglutathione hydrolase [Halieaceae bacterium]